MSQPESHRSSRAERKRARKADEATRYAGDSAGSLSFAAVALVIAGFFVSSGQTTLLRGGDGSLVIVLGVIVGLAGVIALGQGIHALASNFDRVARVRLRPRA